jgi:hypothetical protein
MSEEMTPSELLGLNELSQDTEDNYAARRKAVAINIAGELMAKDAEYERRQSELNGGFIEGLLSDFPHSEFQYTSKIFNPVGKLYGIHFSDVSSPIVFRTGEQIGDVNGELIADISAMRSATIWIPTPSDRLLSISVEYGGSESDNAKSTFPDNVCLPYFVVGHKDEDDSTSVLLAPVAPKTLGSFKQKGVVIKAPVSKGDYSDTADVTWNGKQFIEATISKQNYNKLIQLQETIFDLGLKEDEVARLHDASGAFMLRPDAGVAVLKGIINGIHFGHKTPSSVEDLAHHNFVFSNAQFRDSAINPVEFLSYSVLKEMQRLSAMLNLSQAFQRRSNQLYLVRPGNPSIKTIIRQ